MATLTGINEMTPGLRAYLEVPTDTHNGTIRVPENDKIDGGVTKRRASNRTTLSAGDVARKTRELKRAPAI